MIINRGLRVSKGMKESNNRKVVSIDEFFKELSSLVSQAKKYSGIKVELITPHDMTNARLGIILPRIGTVGTLDAEDAEKYGKDILKVAELIRNFKYNGYARE